jgi:2-iminobutanoate/2-iminopropanoate deaminase
MAQLEMITVPDGPPAGGPYSPAVVLGDLVFTAGQVAVNERGEVVGSTAFDQTIQTLRNLERVLVAAGSSLDGVLKTTCFLVDLSDFAEFNRAYVQVFGAHRPARSTVQVAGLVKGLLVEIECVATRR